MRAIVVIGIVRIVLVVGRDVLLQRPVADLDGVGAPGDLDDRRGRAIRLTRSAQRTVSGSIVAEVTMIFRSGRVRQQLAKVAEQEVDVEAALVRLVQDQRVVAQQSAVALHLGQQDAVGHQLHQRAVADLVGEADGVADGVAELGVQLVGDALPDGAGGEPSRLGVADRAADAAAELQRRSWAAASSCRSPVSPATTTTWCPLIAAAISSRLALTGRSGIGDRRGRPPGASRRPARRG